MKDQTTMKLLGLSLNTPDFTAGVKQDLAVAATTKWTRLIPGMLYRYASTIATRILLSTAPRPVVVGGASGTGIIVPAGKVEPIYADPELGICSMAYISEDATATGRASLHALDAPDLLAIDSCDAVTGWTLSGDGANLTVEAATKLEGTNSLEFDKAGAGATVNLFKTISKDLLPGYKGVTGWLYPSTSITNITSAKLQIGSTAGGANNYYSDTMLNADLSINTWMEFNIPFTAAYATGTPDLNSMIEIRLTIVGTAGATFTDYFLDWIYAYGYFE